MLAKKRVELLRIQLYMLMHSNNETINECYKITAGKKMAPSDRYDWPISNDRMEQLETNGVRKNYCRVAELTTDQPGELKYAPETEHKVGSKSLNLDEISQE